MSYTHTDELKHAHIQTKPFRGEKNAKIPNSKQRARKNFQTQKKKKSPPIGVSKRLLCVYNDVSVLCGNWLSYVAADRWDLIATTINSDYECLKLCSDDSIMTNKLPSDGVLWNYKDTRRRYWFYGLSLVCETWKTKTRFCHGWLLLPPLLLVAFHVFSIFSFLHTSKNLWKSLARQFLCCHNTSRWARR